MRYVRYVRTRAVGTLLLLLPHYVYQYAQCSTPTPNLTRAYHVTCKKNAREEGKEKGSTEIYCTVGSTDRAHLNLTLYVASYLITVMIRLPSLYWTPSHTIPLSQNTTYENLSLPYSDQVITDEGAPQILHYANYVSTNVSR